MSDTASFWDARYQTPDYLFGTEPNAFLRSKRHLLKPGQTALALADGEGRNGVWLAEQGLDVLSTDISSSALEKARTLAADRGVTIRTEHLDLSTWAPSAAQFDVVVAIFVQFAGPALREKIFSGIRTCLKPGGLLLLQGYRPEQLAHGTGGPSAVENFYSRELLERSFAGFDAIDIVAYDAVIREGRGHDGMSALIDLVASAPGQP
jgi:SAM-dependent methyltransferase